jgi:hypothetical protein
VRFFLFKATESFTTEPRRDGEKQEQSLAGIDFFFFLSVSPCLCGEAFIRLFLFALAVQGTIQARTEAFK